MTIKLPRELVDKIDNLVSSGKYGYTSRGDFVADAVRRRLEELDYFPKRE